MAEDYAVGESDRVLYAKQIERIKLRLDEIHRLNRDMRDEHRVLYAAAQLRLAIEEVSFASLVGNRKLLETAERSIRLNGWDKANKALSNVSRITGQLGLSKWRMMMDDGVGKKLQMSSQLTRCPRYGVA